MLHRFEIANISMTPVLQPGDYVIAVRRRRSPRRGELIVFEHASNPGFHLVKRIVGLPGETVEIEAGVVRVNGRPLHDPWATSPSTPGQGTWELRATEIFVLGDVRHASDGDSRQIGPLLASPRMAIVGRYWPRHRIGLFIGAGSP